MNSTCRRDFTELLLEKFNFFGMRPDLVAPTAEGVANIYCLKHRNYHTGDRIASMLEHAKVLGWKSELLTAAVIGHNLWWYPDYRVTDLCTISAKVARSIFSETAIINRPVGDGNFGMKMGTDLVCDAIESSAYAYGWTMNKVKLSGLGAKLIDLCLADLADPIDEFIAKREAMCTERRQNDDWRVLEKAFSKHASELADLLEHRGDSLFLTDEGKEAFHSNAVKSINEFYSRYGSQTKA